MLSECFIASTLASGRVPASTALRDVGVCLQELQPSSSLRSTFKKSSTPPNCLAVNPSHIFAAQAEKAILHVYSRVRGNQEAIVPFPERIRSIAVAGGRNGDILVLGTEGGRLILWETYTGRQVATAPSHLQPVTSLVVDPTSNFILSGSSDASIHVWSIANILTFAKLSQGGDQQRPKSPIRTISNHRAAVTALAVGHSAGRYNIAVSTSKDNTALVWDYQSGRILRVFLLPLAPSCVALDPVDRALYVGYEDGSVQMIDFYKNQLTQHPLHDSVLQPTPSQLSAEDRWLPPSADLGAVESISVSYDGTILLSGHKSGKVSTWNVGRRKYASTIADYTHPVTNLIMLPPNGLPHEWLDLTRVSHMIVKPQYDHGLSDASQAAGSVPGEYMLSAQVLQPAAFRIADGARKIDDFTEALTHAFFPQALIEEGLAELAGLRQQNMQPAAAESVVDAASSSEVTALEAELSTLRKKTAISEAARQATVDEMMSLRSDLASLQDYIDELHEKQEESNRARVQRKSRKEQREAQRREAWFAAEKQGRNGDAAVKEMERGEEILTSETDDQSDE